MKKSTSGLCGPMIRRMTKHAPTHGFIPRMCSVPGAGMTRIRFKEYISVPFALVPWRALLAFTGTENGLSRPAERGARRTNLSYNDDRRDAPRNQ